MIYDEHREERTRWCPRCGAEYRAKFTECADCGVALTRVPPTEPTVTADVDGGDDGVALVAYDLAGWTDDQRQLLELILRGDRIQFRFDNVDDVEQLVVFRADEAKVEEIIDSIEGEPIDET